MSGRFKFLMVVDNSRMAETGDRSLLEMAQEEKQKTLMTIAADLFKDAEIKPLFKNSRLDFLVYNGAIMVDSCCNKIYVSGTEYYDQALRLAETYEKRAGVQFDIIKRDKS